MTKNQLGEACGIDAANIRKYELGKQNPKYETLEKIANAVDLPVSFFTGQPPFLICLYYYSLRELYCFRFETTDISAKILLRRKFQPANI